MKQFVKHKSKYRTCLTYTRFILFVIFFVSISSRGLVRERERPGDPPGVRGPEPDPPGDQAAAPAARHDPGRAAPVRLCHHRWGCQEGDERCVGTGEHAAQQMCTPNVHRTKNNFIIWRRESDVASARFRHCCHFTLLSMYSWETFMAGYEN